MNPIKERFRLQIFSPGLSSMYFQIVVASPIFAILVFFFLRGRVHFSHTLAQYYFTTIHLSDNDTLFPIPSRPAQTTPNQLIFFWAEQRRSMAGTIAVMFVGI